MNNHNNDNFVPSFGKRSTYRNRFYAFYAKRHKAKLFFRVSLFVVTIITIITIITFYTIKKIVKVPFSAENSPEKLRSAQLLSNSVRSNILGYIRCTLLQSAEKGTITTFSSKTLVKFTVPNLRKDM